jgi:hypothetical protein
MGNNLYSMVPVWSSISEDLLAYAKSLSPDYWMSYYNFDATQVPAQLLNRDGFLVSLAQQRKFHAGILRMPPNTTYNWHVDSDRKVGLNMLLQDGQSHCLFATEDFGVRCVVEELQYQPNSYYVFNTQVPHMVLNLEQPRYLFSLEFLDEDRGLTFDELCENIKGMNHGY